MTFRILLFVFAVAPMLAQATKGAQAPSLHGETLEGKKIVLADAGAGKTTLLILGFSKKAGDASAAWRDRFAGDFGANGSAAYFAIAFLEEAPAMMRGMIRSAMRSGTPQAQRSHVVVVTSDEAAWKSWAGSIDDKLPCVKLLDQTGNVSWSWNGAFDAGKYAELRENTVRLLKP